MTAPEWLARELSNGFQALLSLGLKRAPSADVIGMTLDVWLVPITRRLGGTDEERGTKRVRTAFARLFERREWPTPADFLDALPAPIHLPALPVPKQTEAERAVSRERLAAIVEQFFQTKRMR
ncbi:MAG: hypothetical protein FWH56_10725 [Betaproteobacteria bacterium]|nr:hypothetical protein [Betaproteobacteria bacterium]